MLNTTKIKDAIQNDLARDVPGPGYIHIPSWLDQKYIDEITAEQRTKDGWQKIGNRRNETIDLLTYSIGLWKYLTGPRFKWSSPPQWAQPWDSNSEVISADQRRSLKATAPRLPRRVGQRR
jgi:phage terminase large subunit GpA-like protein